MSRILKIDGLIYANGKFHANTEAFYGHARHFNPETKHRDYAKRMIESCKKLNGCPVIIQYNRNMGVVDIRPRVAAVYDRFQGQDVRLCAGKIVRETFEALQKA